MIYSIGCDIAKDNFEVCLLRYDLTQQSFQVVSRKSFANSLSGCKAFIKWVDRLTRKHPLPIRCCMEATGTYYELLADHLYQHCSQWHLSVVLASQASTFLASQGHRSKTDKIDAYGLAQMGGQRKLDRWKGFNPFWRKLRDLTRTRTALQDQITQLKNQRHAYERTPMKLDKINQVLNESIAVLDDKCEELERLIDQHLNSNADYEDRIKCLDSITGVGSKTIAVILAETMGFEAFHRKSQLLKFSGYDVQIRQSGKFRGEAKISKQGNAHIRKAMYMPANSILSRKNSVLYGYYQRLLQRHNIPMKAHVALQKKLLSYMYFLWKKQEMFDPEKITSDYKKRVAPHFGEATVDTSAPINDTVFFIDQT